MTLALTLDQTKALYRAEIAPEAHDAWGSDWWAEVYREIEEVIAAESLDQAANVISWWHHDWSAVSDSPRAAALRIRRAAMRIRSRRN